MHKEFHKELKRLHRTGTTEGMHTGARKSSHACAFPLGSVAFA